MLYGILGYKYIPGNEKVSNGLIDDINALSKINKGDSNDRNMEDNTGYISGVDNIVHL